MQNARYSRDLKEISSFSKILRALPHCSKREKERKRAIKKESFD